MRIQEILYNMEVGGGRVWITRFFLLVGFVALSLLYSIGQFNGFGTMEAMDAGQVARQLVRGEGYTTKFIRPTELGLLQDFWKESGKDAAANLEKGVLPEIYEAPMYPLALTAAFRLTGVSFDVPADKLKEFRVYTPERIMISFNQFCIFLTAIVIYIWGVRLFDERVGILAATLFVFSDIIWQFAISGLSTSWVMLVVTLFCLAVHEALRSQEEGSVAGVWAWNTGSAVLLALVILSRWSLIWLVVGFVIFLGIFFKARLALVPVMGVLVLMLISPWAIRNSQVSGSVWGGMPGQMQSGVYENGGTIRERSIYPKKDSSILKVTAYKTVSGLKFQFEKVFELLGAGIVVMFFVTGVFYSFRRWRARAFRVFLIGFGLLLVVCGAMITPKPEMVSAQNNMALILPGIIIFGAAFFYVILDRMEIELQIVRYLVIGAFGIVNGVPMLLTLAPPGVGVFKYPPYCPPFVRLAGSWLQPQEKMVSDMPWATAWYGDRTSIWLPATVEEYYDLHSRMLKTNGMLLTPLTGNRALISDIDKGEFKDWAGIVRRQGLPALFPLSSFTPMPPNENEYLFLSDKVRWRDAR